MAKEITFTDLGTPQNLAGEAVEGGTLEANTTYYYIVYAVTSTTTDHSNYQQEWVRGLMSEEISVTTDNTKKSVSLTWDAVPGAGGYRIHRCKGYSIKSGLAMSTTLRAVTTTNSFTDDGSYAQYIYGTPYCDGVHGQITVSGGTSADPITIADLYNADVAGSWGVIQKQGAREYTSWASVIMFATAETYLAFIDINIKMYGYFDCLSGTNNRVLRFGVKHPTEDITYDGCYVTIQQPSSGYHAFFRSDVSNHFYVNAYETTFYGNSAGFIGYPVSNKTLGIEMGINGGCDWRDLQFIKNRSVYVQGSNNIVRRIRTQSQSENIWYWYPDSTSEITDISAQVSSTPWAIQNSGSNSWKAKNITLNALGMVYHYDYSGEFSIVDTDLTSVPNKMYWVYDNGSKIKDYKTVNLSVVDEENNAISGASIVCCDKDNNTVFSATTDANGKIDEQEVLYAIHTSGAPGQSGSAGGYVTDTLLYSPFTITISKTGYETYYQKHNIDTKINQTITLKKAVPNLIDDSGRIFRKINVVNQGNNRNFIIKL